MRFVRATARLQFHRDFPLSHGIALVPYLAKLGVSHVYASPLLMSRPGSTHGYDIVDHNRIDPELGGEAALIELVAALRAHDMGLVLDIVPNHMGVGGADNAWWLDVLEWGRASPYAGFFDIDWEPTDPALRGKLLAPFLGQAYGEALAAGDIRLRFDPDDGRFFVAVYDEHRFPINPRDYPAILRAGGGGLDGLADRFADSAPNAGALRARAVAGRAELRASHAARSTDFDAAVAVFAPDDDSGRERLHRLLERQAYRLAWWRAATDEINWRRFFDINGLAGMRQEQADVFDATHATILRLYAEGLIDGVRIDHVDGLADPRGYCRKLHRRLQTAQAQRPERLRDLPPILWIEKILFAHERLATDWLTDGTTGYDFMNEVAAVLHDPAGEASLTEMWTSLTGRSGDFEVETEAARRQILREALSSELHAAAAAFHRILRRATATRDWTLTGVRRTLEELLAHFHTYRIYAGPGGASESDQAALAWAVAGARRTARPTQVALLDVLLPLISGDGLRAVPPGTQRQERARAMVRFQQLSAPTAAKSVEDTSFYRYGRLLSRNEVGSEPSQWAMTVQAFHATARDRRRRFPRALLATATHDHKRGEDTRARLAVLSEVPEEWRTAVTRWVRLNAPAKRDVDGALAPDAADELMLYQTLVSAWPLELSADDAAGLATYRDRVAGWLEKALREAKRHTGWAIPNEAYEAAARDFLVQCLDPARASGVARELATFAMRIAPAGAVNGLAQTVLRLTSPGVPDLYQGAEFWDFSLVDPDNRRPVDFTARAASLQAAAPFAALLQGWRDGRVKQAVIGRVLDLRARMPALFAEGSYLPLKSEGPAADHVIAFARVHEGRAIVTVVSRHTASLVDRETSGLVATKNVWKGTFLPLPRSLMERRWTDVLSGAPAPIVPGSRLDIAAVLGECPVAVWGV